MPLTSSSVLISTKQLLQVMKVFIINWIRYKSGNFQAVHGTSSARPEQRTLGMQFSINYSRNIALHLIQTQLDISGPYWTIDYVLICNASCPIYIPFTRAGDGLHVCFCSTCSSCWLLMHHVTWSFISNFKICFPEAWNNSTSCFHFCYWQLCTHFFKSRFIFKYLRWAGKAHFYMY